MLSVDGKAKKAGTKAPKPAAAPAQTDRVEENTKAKAAAEANAPVQSDVESDIIGSKSDTLVFVAPLEDPSNEDTTEVMVDGAKVPLTTGTIVGYRFKSTEPITIPDCGLDINFKKDKMNYINADGTRQVKANEEFDLTPFEMALLFARPEYNTVASGGNYPVKCTYNFSGSRAKDGAIMKTNKTPRASLRGMKTSVKQMPMIKVLEFTTTKGENGVNVKNRTINQGFEKWAPLCERAAGNRQSSLVDDNKKVYSKQAQTFLSLIKQKK